MVLYPVSVSELYLDRKNEFYVLNDVAISKGLFVYDRNNRNYFIETLNEYADYNWVGNRFHKLPDLGLKYGKATSNADSTITIDFYEESDGEKNGRYLLFDYIWGHNYQHWLLSAFTRLMYSKEFLISNADVKLLIREDTPNYQREFLSLIGLDEGRFEVINPKLDYKCLYIPPFHSKSGIKLTEDAIRGFECLANDMGNKALGHPSLLYISRDDAGKRPLKNRSDLDVLLAKKGFTKLRLEELSVFEKVSYFSKADVIIGDFSAGWAHVVFCKPGCRLILLEHAIFKFSSFYRQISQKKGVDFVFVDKLSAMRKVYYTLLKVIWRLTKTSDKYANEISWSVNVSEVEKVLNENINNKSKFK
jgi:hypothetical protein